MKMNFDRCHQKLLQSHTLHILLVHANRAYLNLYIFLNMDKQTILNVGKDNKKLSWVRNMERKLRLKKFTFFLSLR